MVLLDKLIDDLKATKDFDGFDRKVDAIRALHDRSSIAPLLLLLVDANRSEDETDGWTILHAAEDFAHEVYMEELLGACPAVAEGSWEWASLVFMRVLNSEVCRLHLIRRIRDVEPLVRISIVSLLQRIKYESPEFIPKTSAVILAADGAATLLPPDSTVQ